jgi:hypothetical protein
MHPLRPRPCTPEYDRTRDLANILPLWPDEIEDVSLAPTVVLVGRLRRALREERRRGMAGHWAYDLARHVRLRDAYRAETERLQRLLATQANNSSTNAGMTGSPPSTGLDRHPT